MLPKSLHKDSISILHSMIENALNPQHQWKFKVKQNQAEYGSSKEKKQLSDIKEAKITAKLTTEQLIEYASANKRQSLPPSISVQSWKEKVITF